MSAKRVIHTASGTVTIGQYVQAWRTVKAAPEGQEFKSSLNGWWPATREEILREFSEGVQDRINQHVPYMQRGIKSH